MIADIITRIGLLVPTLTGRIEGAMSLADLMKRNAVPQAPIAAFVIPLGLVGAGHEAGSGYFTQMFEEVVGVIVSMRGYDRTGGPSVDPLDALIRAVINAVAGWGPATAPGVYRLRSGRMASMEAGTAVYQIEFALINQLRITP